MKKITKALISLSNKEGAVTFAQSLANLGITILSTGGTAKLLRQHGIPITDVSEYTSSPEIMNGRVKTLHPKIHGGILGKRDNESHCQEAKENGIEWIDLVVVNLYPFREVVAKEDVSFDEVIENIDIGGPSMVRSAAKNYQSVGIVCDPADYAIVLQEIKETGVLSDKTREYLALKAFSLTASYDASIDTYLNRRLQDKEVLYLHLKEGEKLRYGENPHQKAFFFHNTESKVSSPAQGNVLGGKAMSYNNYVDADAAYALIKELPKDVPSVAVIKHMNPCGLGTGENLTQAAQAAWQGDPISAFGSIIAVNTKVDLAFAKFFKDETQEHYAYTVEKGEYVANKVKDKFIEVIIAPAFDEDAATFLQEKSKVLRLVEVGYGKQEDLYEYRSLVGGFLCQERDLSSHIHLNTVTKKNFLPNSEGLVKFGIIACKHTKSNAVVLVGEYKPGFYQVYGMGAGQPNRVDSMRKLAVAKAKENLLLEYKQNKITEDFDLWYAKRMSQLVLISDAFFPFDDTVREAHECGIRYIVQPGGSKRDIDSIVACNELDMAMICTDMRHFKH